MGLVVRPSRIHSVGVFTTAPIRRGARVVEYAGPRITPQEADRLYDGAPRTYLYGLEDGKTIIDGEGLGAYLNHSCDPNCEIDEIKRRVWILPSAISLRARNCCGITTSTTMKLPRRATVDHTSAAAPCIRGNGLPRCGARRGKRS
jgi:hypothetical protein